MKVCEYVYMRGTYKGSCGAQSVSRPTGRCDKCGRKPVEVKNARNT